MVTNKNKVIFKHYCTKVIPFKNVQIRKDVTVTKGLTTSNAIKTKCVYSTTYDPFCDVSHPVTQPLANYCLSCPQSHLK